MWKFTSSLWKAGAGHYNAVVKQLGPLRSSVSEMIRKETLRKQQYYQNLKNSVNDSANKGWKYTLQSTKYHLKHTPIYVFKVVRIGTYYGWQAVKIVGRTKPGKAVKGVLIMYISGRVFYVYGTRFNRDITVSKTFQRIGENGNDELNEYMLSDITKRIYRVRNSPWYMQFYSTEMWTDIEVGKTYNVTGYGFRLAALGIYPNIVHMEPPEEKEQRKKRIQQIFDKLKSKLPVQKEGLVATSLIVWGRKFSVPEYQKLLENDPLNPLLGFF